jgi:hypothetical protein
VRKFWSAAWPVLLMLSIVGGLVGTPAYVIRQSEIRRMAEAREAERRCGMYAGNIVEAVIDGRRGMVTSIYSGWVWVRFAQPHATTDVALLGGDGPIGNAPYSEVRMACFELRMSQVE